MNEKSIQQKLKSLQNVDLQDKAGLKTLIAALDNPVLEIRAQAYWSLKNCEDEDAKSAIDTGVKLNPGDMIYCVYESVISFDDQYYKVHDNISDLECYLCLGLNREGQRRIDHQQSIKKALSYGFQDSDSIFSDLVYGTQFLEWAIDHKEESNTWLCDEYSPQLRAVYLSHSIAEQIAQKLALDVQKTNPAPLSSCDLKPYPTNSEGFDLNTWCREYQIPYEEMCRCRFLDNDYSDEGSWEHSYRFIERVENHLLENHQYDLWEKLWSDAIGKLAFVKTVTVRELTYLSLSTTTEVFKCWA